MIQAVLVMVVFIGALAYLGWTIYNQLQAKSSCATGCGKCSVVDFQKIEVDLKTKGL
jgi:bacterioferritin-associated ferredoxin